jgi:hypothetical protein
MIVYDTTKIMANRLISHQAPPAAFEIHPATKEMSAEEGILREGGKNEIRESF